MDRALPRNITSYDVLKMVAVLLMLVDHTGYYFFLEEQWWRVAGRLCVPIWFFLIGYARSRDLGAKLWIGGLILVAADYAAGHQVIPPNILFSMIIVRIILDPLMRFCTRGVEGLAFCVIAMSVFVMVSQIAFEYGFVGVALAMFGWFMRNRDDPTMMHRLSPSAAWGFVAYVYAFFVIVQAILFAFNPLETTVLAAGTAAVFAVLIRFRPAEFPAMTARLGRGGAALVRFFGRRTLEIYVAHLVLFKGLGVLTDPERFVPFTFKWVLSGAGG